jgi:hypothetical protein
VTKSEVLEIKLLLRLSRGCLRKEVEVHGVHSSIPWIR